MFSSWSRKRTQRRFKRRLLPHADALYQFAFRLTRSPEDAEDLLQDTFLKAYSALDRLPEGSNYRAWLFTILRNTWVSHCRRSGRIWYSPSPPDRPCVRPDPLTSMTWGLSGVPEARFDDVVLCALNRLPEVQRTAVILCDVEQMTYEDIAQILKCPVGTVRSRIFHARRRLREALSNYAVAEGVIRENDPAVL